jgi:hypothetical protein
MRPTERSEESTRYLGQALLVLFLKKAPHIGLLSIKNVEAKLRPFFVFEEQRSFVLRSILRQAKLVLFSSKLFQAKRRKKISATHAGELRPTYWPRVFLLSASK